MADTQQQAPKSAKFVTVACKMPNGMILHLQEEYTDHEQTPNGVRDIKRHRKVGEAIHIAGSAMPVGVPNPPRKMIVGGYALTRNVPADFWEKWFTQNKDADYVKNRIIFAMPTRDDAESQAEKNEGVRSGMEPLDPSIKTGRDGSMEPADPRFPRAMGGISAVTTGSREA